MEIFHNVNLKRVACLIVIAIILGLTYFKFGVLEKNPIYLFEKGNIYFGGGKYDINKAEKYFSKVVELSPKASIAHYQLCRINFINGKFEKALSECNAELEINPKYNKTLYVRALVYAYSGRLDLSAEDFKAFLKTKPESWAAHNDLAWVYFMKGDFKESEVVARDGLKFDPYNPWLLNSLGLALLNQSKDAESVKYFEEALIEFKKIGPEGWGMAYPGNNPRDYQTGFDNAIESIELNLKTARGLNN